MSKNTPTEDTPLLGELAKVYNPHAIERDIYQRWEQAGWFAPSAGSTGNGAPYCIMIPPPNVTGSLHMGHAFQDTLMDALTRYHRMCGDNTLWQPGTDHAGIATQMVVERLLEAEGKTRHDLGRDEFTKRVWQWKEQSGGTITRQLRRMGASVDWSHERFTMDEGLSDAVKEVFVRLYEEDLIYRGKRLVNWDPVLHTAVSDLEVISEEESGHMWHMRYPLANGTGHVVVATTRPETMLGDSAVAVHPDDDRYKDIVGKMLTLPLTGREIPVIADEYVDPAFGSGCVKITPAHDFNDYEVGLRHDLPQINIFTVDAAIDLPGSKYHGLDRYEARDVIVHDLDQQGLLEKVVDHKLMVPRGDRSGAVIEPYLTDQWYVKIQPLADPAIKAVENGDIRFVPENWAKTYFEWMRNIQDWCISRQIWWGHRIPAWYDDDGKVYVGRSEQEVRDKHKLGGIPLRQDEDVLDTWFSSALWPFSTLGWPDATERLKTFYPTSVLVTGFDIIFFWVARMIMMGIKFMGDVPFKEVYVTGLIRDSQGHKMSKSKGNVLDPIDLIDGISLDDLLAKRTTGMMQPKMKTKIERQTRKEFPEGMPAFGTDALRFTLAALATTGRDINFDLGRIEGYRNFCNKLWNAARYVLMNTEGQDCGQAGGDVELNAADRWLTSRLQQVEADVAKHMQHYRFDHMADVLYHFVWDEYCSWYLELSKVVLNDDNASDAAKRGTRQTLVRALETLLRLMHPVMPYVTEEIWQKVHALAGVEGDTIMRQPYPMADEDKIDQTAINEVQWVMEAINGIRNIRGELDIAPSKRIDIIIQGANKEEQSRYEQYAAYVTFLARVDNAEFIGAKNKAPESAAAIVGKIKFLVPLAGLIDKQAEMTRLAKAIEKMERELINGENRLANKNFTEKAPEQVVNQLKEQVAATESKYNELKQQLEKIAALPD